MNGLKLMWCKYKICVVPSAPGVGVVILAIVRETVSVPTISTTLIMGVDHTLDINPTAINICGDLLASRLMDDWIAKETPEIAKTPA